jgi:hypothetical protein
VISLGRQKFGHTLGIIPDSRQHVLKKSSLATNKDLGHVKLSEAARTSGLFRKKCPDLDVYPALQRQILSNQ